MIFSLFQSFVEHYLSKSLYFLEICLILSINNELYDSNLSIYSMVLLAFLLLEHTTLAKGYSLLNQTDSEKLKLAIIILYGYIAMFLISTLGEIIFSIILIVFSTQNSWFTNNNSSFLIVTLYMILIRSIFILSFYLIRKTIDIFCIGYYEGGANEEFLNNYRLMRRLQEDIK